MSENPNTLILRSKRVAIFICQLAPLPHQFCHKSRVILNLLTVSKHISFCQEYHDCLDHSSPSSPFLTATMTWQLYELFLQYITLIFLFSTLPVNFIISHLDYCKQCLNVFHRLKASQIHCPILLLRSNTFVYFLPQSPLLYLEIVV